VGFGVLVWSPIVKASSTEPGGNEINELILEPRTWSEEPGLDGVPSTVTADLSEASEAPALEDPLRFAVET